MDFLILLKVFVLKVCSAIYALNGGFVGNVGETPIRKDKKTRREF